MRILPLICAVSLTIATAARAATSTWTGGGGNVNWSTLANWGSGPVPVSGQNTDLVFAGTTNTGTAGTPLNNNIADPITLNSITFASGAGTFYLGGLQLRFDGSLLNSNANTITQNSSSAQYITNTITSVGLLLNATNTITMTGNGTGIVTVSAIIDGNGQRDYAISKTGTSTYVLTGNNTYGGSTTVTAGTLIVGNANGLGATSTGTTVSSGGTLGFQGGLTFGLEALTISGTGATGQNGALVNVSGTNNFGGAITLGANSTISSDSGTLNLSGAIGGATFGLTLTGSGDGSISSAIATLTGSVTKTGTGTWTLSGANTYTGGTNINGGTLALGSSGALGSLGTISFGGGTLQYSASNTTDYSSRFSNAASQQYSIDTNGQSVTFATALTSSGGTLTKLGTGTLTLNAANTYSGGTTVSAGTLFVNNSSGSGTGTGTVTVNGAGTLGGSGTITGAVNVSASGAKINAGGTTGAVGTLATGALTLSSASILSVDMTSTTADRINVTGAVNITSASLQLSIPNGTVFTAGQTFTLISNDGVDAISGAFSNAAAGTDTINGYLWIVSYTGGDGNDFTIQAVPEPSTWLSGLLALVGIIWMARRNLGHQGRHSREGEARQAHKAVENGIGP